MSIAEKLDKMLYQVSNPVRYIGNEWNQIKKEWTNSHVKILLTFPDVYEIGMSHLGLKILYHRLNEEDKIICERTYAPWFDMEELMRREDIPLYSLETKAPASEFDIIGFSLQYEMSYTTIINMINLAGIPVYSHERSEEDPLIISGGSTVYNPEPLADFFDLFFIGEAESGLINLVNKYRKLKDKGLKRKEILFELNKLPGVYVPSLYSVDYDDKGRINSIVSKEDGVKERIKRQVITDLDNSFYPTDFIVPYMDIVHNRAVLEVLRGCTRGCRFCAAGMTYRPVRERKINTLIDMADKILQSTGYEELSLSSLSTVDYSDIERLVKIMAERYREDKISISLSSLRVDEFSVKLAKEVQKVRKTGLTFAPEAGTQRLRNVINKGVNEKDLYQAVKSAFTAGWSRIKLYYMMGLPSETDTDLEGIAKMSKKVLDMGRKLKKTKRGIKVSVSVSTFIPKPFTPFQWVEMNSQEEIIKKQDLLRKVLRGRGLQFSWNDPELSLMESILARGDRRLSGVIYQAWKQGSKFDGWNECFDFELWNKAFNDNELDYRDYLRKRDFDEILPWSHIYTGVTDEFLKKEYEKSLKGELTKDCRESHCHNGCDVCYGLGASMELVGGTNDAQG